MKDDFFGVALTILTACFQFIIFFVLPIGIPIVGGFLAIKRKRSEKPLKRFLLVFALIEIISLLPVIRISSYEDGLFALMLSFGCGIASMVLTLPVILPIISAFNLLKRKNQNKRIMKPAVILSTIEILLIAIAICAYSGYGSEMMTRILANH